jgi:hypothetical protein
MLSRPQEGPRVRLVYGGYSHDLNEAAVTVTRSPVWNQPGGQLRGYVERWAVSGFLQGVNPADVNARCQALKAAYLTPAQDLTLRFDDGGLSNHLLLSGPSVGGTRVVEGVSFPHSGEGDAEFSTFRRYSLAVEAEYHQAGLNILAWVETLAFSGGGPRDLFLQPLAGTPRKQRVATATPYRATQKGSALGWLSFPELPAPLWPSDEKVDLREGEKGEPRRSGPVGAPLYTEWPVTWSYTFESVNPFTGDPHPWPE